jgi:aryl-alcohol dehydrogenase-like predicted oxidoreductase
MPKTQLQTAQLVSTGLEISRSGFGAWALGGGGWEFGWGPREDEQSIAAIGHALEQGVNWIDTAAAYGFGRSERVVGRAIEGLTEQPYVFTKCSLLEGPGRRGDPHSGGTPFSGRPRRSSSGWASTRSTSTRSTGPSPRRTSRRDGRRWSSSGSGGWCGTSASPTSTCSTCAASGESRP